ncbi:MAG: CRISPR-associated endonuclease Cas2 [Patescibacteria group bacterium]
MGKLESRSARRTRITKLQRAVLGTVAAAGMLSVAILAPNAIRLLNPIIKKIDRSRQNSIQRARQLLVEKGLLSYVPNKPGFVSITNAGSALVEKFVRTNYSIKSPKHWDGKWRVLIFDISEKRKNTRHQLRSTLQSVGFIRLQDSVWVYPYPCEELTALLKADLKIGSSLLYLIVEEMEGDKEIRKIFNLSAKTT